MPSRIVKTWEYDLPDDSLERGSLKRIRYTFFMVENELLNKSANRAAPTIEAAEKLARELMAEWDKEEKQLLQRRKTQAGKDEASKKTQSNSILCEKYTSILRDGVLNESLFDLVDENDDVEQAIQTTLELSEYPEGFQKEFEAAFNRDSMMIIINYRVPSLHQIPRAKSFKYDINLEKIIPVDMKPKEFEQFYENTIHQVALRTIYEVHRSIKQNEIESILFNGWVRGINSSTGQDFITCILSILVSCKEFVDINLLQVIPRECIKHFKGLNAGPLALLAPVRPLLEINRTDSRFVESREILSTIDDAKNLAEMDWEDFEHLVRELFQKVFSHGDSEVRVTQASRDGGIDAIAFDSDPIRGGKFVIQAKRFNNVVPVSAVRDLYGAVINEGAVKGILVTTSYYGSDSREFAKNKPITLIDGANLVHMLQEYGYSAKIELRKNKTGRSIDE